MRSRKLPEDPFIEHEHLSQMQVPEEKRYRETKTKFVIADYPHSDEKTEIEFVVKKHGGIEIKYHSWTERRTSKSIRCDLGHFHPVLAREKTQYSSFELEPKEAGKFKKFLQRGGKWKGFGEDDE